MASKKKPDMAWGQTKTKTGAIQYRIPDSKTPMKLVPKNVWLQWKKEKNREAASLRMKAKILANKSKANIVKEKTVTQSPPSKPSVQSMQRPAFDFDAARNSGSGAYDKTNRESKEKTQQAKSEYVDNTSIDRADRCRKIIDRFLDIGFEAEDQKSKLLSLVETINEVKSTVKSKAKLETLLRNVQLLIDNYDFFIEKNIPPNIKALGKLAGPQRSSYDAEKKIDIIEKFIEPLLTKLEILVKKSGSMFTTFEVLSQNTVQTKEKAAVDTSNEEKKLADLAKQTALQQQKLKRKRYDRFFEGNKDKKSSGLGAALGFSGSFRNEKALLGKLFSPVKRLIYSSAGISDAKINSAEMSVNAEKQADKRNTILNKINKKMGGNSSQFSSAGTKSYSGNGNSAKPDVSSNTTNNSSTSNAGNNSSTSNTYTRNTNVGGKPDLDRTDDNVGDKEEIKTNVILTDILKVLKKSKDVIAEDPNAVKLALIIGGVATIIALMGKLNPFNQNQKYVNKHILMDRLSGKMDNRDNEQLAQAIADKKAMITTNQFDPITYIDNIRKHFIDKEIKNILTRNNFSSSYIDSVLADTTHDTKFESKINNNNFSSSNNFGKIVNSSGVVIGKMPKPTSLIQNVNDGKNPQLHIMKATSDLTDTVKMNNKDDDGNLDDIKSYFSGDFLDKFFERMSGYLTPPRNNGNSHVSNPPAFSR